MKSKVTLYYKSLVNKEKNFVLDNQDGTLAIETYLSTLTSESIDNFQYIKQGLSVSIKLDKSQVALEMVDSKDLNYVKIQNFDVVNEQEVLEKPYYYFVIAKNWRAKETIELVLSMDTLNTFRFNYDYKLNAKTLTKRMHKDRFQYGERQEILLGEMEDIDSYATSGDIWNYLNEDDYFDIDLELDSQQATLFREYGGEIKITYIYDATLGRNLEPNEYDSHQAEFGIEITESNKILLTWNIPITTSATDEYYFGIELIGQTIPLIRKIDLKSENISCPVYKTKEDILKEQNGTFDNTWVLYYKNASNQENSPIDCYLTSDFDLQVLAESGTPGISIADVPANKTLLVCQQYNGNISFDVDGRTLRVYTEAHPNYVIPSLSYTDTYVVAFQNRNNVLVVYYLKYRNTGTSQWTLILSTSIINPTQVVINGAFSELKVREVDQFENSYLETSSNFPFFADRYSYAIPLAGVVQRILLNSSTINKTLNENVKIINIPYCPSQLTENANNTYTIESLWKYDSSLRFFKLTDFSSKFENSITTNAQDILSIFKIEFIPHITDNRYVLDSKLFHSDFFRYKFVYDSFSRIFPLEQINYDESFKLNDTNKFKFTFIMTRNIVSKFLFKFDYVYDYSNEDYPNIVAVARNNEEVLYNSAYLNYIRTGYNYDLKSKERQEITGSAGIGLSVLGLLASGVIGGMTGNPLAIGSAVASGIGLASSLINLAKTNAQNEENIQRKLQETQRQAVSVLNADDYDLLYAYTLNKAKLTLYEVSEQVKNVLDDLFYYCGYIIDEQMIPDAYSRYWFNFVQAGLIIEDSSNLNGDIEDDIKEKFEQGVTFLHNHNGFDFNQEKENWETSLLD